MELQNLNELAHKLQSQFMSNFKADDILLPENFKQRVKGNGEYTFSYKKYMVHMNSVSLNGYIPNSWFVIASYFVEYYDELQKYKKLLLESLEEAGIKDKTERENILSRFPKLWDSKVKLLDKKLKSSETISKCQNEAALEIFTYIEPILAKTSLSDNNKKLLNLFVSDYRWWYGGKGLERNDFYVSPILTLTKVVNASHSYIAELCKFLSEQKIAAAMLRHPKAIIVDNSLPVFFIQVFKYLYANENFLVDMFVHLTPGQSNSVRYAFDFNGIRQTNFFIKGEDNFKAARKGDFNEYPFIYQGEKYYMSQELTKQRDTKNEISFYGLKKVIESLYNSYELIEESNIYIFNCNKTMKDNCNLQQIFYGAPGTGKSHEINKQTAGYAVIRTTFHPDSDYSTFVGCYKPSMMKADLRDGSGHIINDASEEEKNKITYKFVKQAFLKAYLGAWKKYSEAGDKNAEPQFLVIEEINRGNCAQIFGDLFQLLDREDNGFSSYPIDADTDLQQEIANAFVNDAEYKLEKDINIEDAIANYTSNYGETLSADIQNGRVLLLPPNLFIWATMNTSDQSLFPIDSAFKRRWDWKYMPINTKKESWSISVDGKMYSWSDFLDKMNYEIGEQTSSEDKKLGFYFCKAENNVISAERFVSKVLFYIYNDVFKDYEFDRDFFKRKSDNKVISFQSLYDCESGNVNESVVAELLDNLEVDKEENNPN